MIKKKNYWFKPAKDTDRLTIANKQGFLLILGYASVLGLTMSLISVWVEDDQMSAWVGIPIAVIVCLISTGFLFHVAVKHSKYAKKIKKR